MCKYKTYNRTFWWVMFCQVGSNLWRKCTLSVSRFCKLNESRTNLTFGDDYLLCLSTYICMMNIQHYDYSNIKLIQGFELIMVRYATSCMGQPAIQSENAVTREDTVVNLIIETRRHEEQVETCTLRKATLIKIG